MFRIDLFRTGEYLLLTPRWGEWSPWAQIPVLLLLCAIPLFLIIWLYRYEMKIITSGVASMLLTLRIVVIFLILFLVCLQPTYARDTSQELSGRVIVAVDVSKSMQVLDPQRPAEDKLRLARALKLNEGVTEKELSSWILAHTVKKPIEWVSEEEKRQNPATYRDLAKQRKEKHDALLEKVDKLTRSEIAKRVLNNSGVDLLDQLKSSHQVDLYGFALDLRKVNEQSSWESQLFGADGKKDGDDSRLISTDLSLPLVESLNRTGASGGKILGMVLLTDGQHNLPDSPLDRTAGAAERKMPIYPIAVGAHKAPSDVAILGMSIPPTVFQDVDVNVTVRFRVTDLKKQDLKVKLFKPGKENEPIKEKTIQHDGTNQEYYESFQIRLNEPGTQILKVKVEPQGTEVKETDQDNNQRTAMVNVAKDKADVLVIDGEARWELHYLFNALLRDRSMDVKSVVFIQPRLGNVPESELQKMNYPALALPKVEDPVKDPLFKYDCIILGDVLPSQLPLQDRKRLEKYVADRGGTLVMLAGKRAMPLAYRADLPERKEGEPKDLIDEEKLDPLFRMLPIEKATVISPDTGFNVTMTQEGRMTPYLQLEPGGSAEANDSRWSQMRKHYWGVVGKARPGATTLAYVAGEQKDLKPEELRKQERERSLIVAHNYGFGQVLYVGVDSTWRWRYRVGDLYHHRFWGQTIRWAASDKPLVTGNKNVRFGTAKPIYRHDEKVNVLVRLEEILGKLPKNLEARARIQRKKADGKDEQVAFVKLHGKTYQPRALEGEIPQLLPGEYFIELDIPELKDRLELGATGENKEPLRAKFSVAGRDDGEMVELATNYQLLKQLATQTQDPEKGESQVYTPETASELVKLLKDKSSTKIEHRENPLWQWWPTLALLIGLLTIEWVMRKWAGLP